MSETTKILLSEASSAVLLARGNAFMIAGRASHPDDGKRVVLHLVPVEKTLADAACGVILGTHRAVKIRQPKEGGTTP